MSEVEVVRDRYERWLSGRTPTSVYVRWYLRHRRAIEAPALWGAIGAGVYPRVLDVGCAGGFYLRDAWCRGHGRELLAGVDITPTLLSEARRRLEPVAAQGGCVEIVEASATELPFGDAAFDAVLSSGMVKYLDDADLDRFLHEARRVLAEGGRLVVAEFARRVNWGSRADLDRIGIPTEHLRIGAQLAEALAAAGFAEAEPFVLPRIRRIPLTFEGAVATRV